MDGVALLGAGVCAVVLIREGWIESHGRKELRDRCNHQWGAEFPDTYGMTMHRNCRACRLQQHQNEDGTWRP